MDEKFRELYQRMARSEVAAIKGQCDLILAEACGFQRMRPQQQRVACQSLARVTETAGVAIAASFGRVVDCITDLSNFSTQEYPNSNLPAHLEGAENRGGLNYLNCEQLKKGVGFVREVERAINSMYTVIGWRLNHMHQVIEAHQMHTRKEHFQAKAREALESVYTDLGAWEQDIQDRTVGPYIFSREGDTVKIRKRPGAFEPFKPIPASLWFTLTQEARDIGRLREHVQQLHDQI